MKKLLKKEKAITLISLVVAISVMIIISSLLIYNAKTGIKVRNLKMMQNDIELLNDKVEAYYVKYGALPVEIKYNIDSLSDSFKNILNPNDNENYYVLDLKAFEGLTLNYGNDFNSVTSSNVADYTDLYIINEQSHQIYYVRGIEMDGVAYYTNDIPDEVGLLSFEKENSWKIYIYDKDDGEQTSGEAIIEIYKDEALTDILEQVTITNGYYDGSSNIPESGTYYVQMIKAPDKYAIPATMEFQISKNKIGIWKIGVDPLRFLPSTGGYYSMAVEPAEYNISDAIDWESMVKIMMEMNPQFLKQNMSIPINVYQIGDKYDYTSDFKDLEKIMSLSTAMNYQLEAENGDKTNFQKIMDWSENIYNTIIENSLEPFICTEAKNSFAQIELERSGTYFIIVEPFYTEEYYCELGGFTFFAPFLSKGFSADAGIEGAFLRNASIYIDTLADEYNFSTENNKVVYRIDNYKGDSNMSELFLSKVITATLNPEGFNHTLISGLYPRGYTEITMLYCGQYYECTGETTQIITAVADENGKTSNYSNFYLGSLVSSENETILPTITEKNNIIDTNTKSIYITNTSDIDIFVRAKIFVPTEYDFIVSSEKWVVDSNEEYYYYSDIIKSGQQSNTLEVIVDSNLINSKDIDVTNTVVIVETTPVLYDEYGNPYANWNES